MLLGEQQSREEFWRMGVMMLEVETLAPCRKLTLLTRKAQAICLTREPLLRFVCPPSSSILKV